MGTSTEELSNDIARTRADLEQDLDALQDKVSPSAIMERRKSAVRGRLASAKDRVMGTGHSVVGSGQDAAHGVSSATSNAGSALEDRVEGSPLAAGLVAFGAGLLIAGLMPATKVEAEGAQKLMDVAQEHGQPVIDQAKSAAQEDRQDAQWSARLLRWPAGRLWLGLLGVVLVVIALFLVSRAARRSFRPRLDRRAMSRRTWRAALITGTIGYLGRAALFATVGACILRASAENDPQSGQGVDGSIRILADSSVGPVLLWLIALTLATYGGYMGIESRYRHV